MTRTLIDATEVSRRTGLSLRSLRRRRELKREPVSFRLAGRVVYDALDVDRWVEQQRDEGLRRVGKDPDLEARREAWLARHLAAALPLTSDQADLIRRVLAAPVDAGVA